MNHVFDAFWSRFGQGGLILQDWPWSGADAICDVVESKDAVKIPVELPGMEMKDIEAPATPGFVH